MRHHPVQVWRILTQRLDWRLQRPRRTADERDQAAIERDERAIARWVAED